MKLVLIAVVLLTIAVIVLYLMIVDERRKTREDISEAKYYFIKQLIKRNEQVKYETGKRR